ncbi:MAG: membrane protein insertase YidC [Desulfobulbaceae bacterium]|nr:MAG: membrane protein insertase YidC [Desulfobulbaceae bacterium]
MDNYRAILAIVLAFFILLGYQYLFVAPEQEQRQPVVETTAEQAPQPRISPQVVQPTPAPAEIVQAEQTAQFEEPVNLPAQKGRDIVVETSKYIAVISETGGGMKSFKLKNYRETSAPDAELKELISTESYRDFPLYFTWGVEPSRAQLPLFVADKETLQIAAGESQTLTMTAQLASGLQITRRMVFAPDSYLINLSVSIDNFSETPLQGSPFISLTNRPFGSISQRYLFSGPAVLLDGKLQEVKPKELEEAAQTLQGNITWVAFEGTYFMTGVIPENQSNQTLKLSAEGDIVNSLLLGPEDIIAAAGALQYNYQVYFGPKRITTLKEAGHDLERVVNFGWFDKLARPALYLLNFFYGYVGNYGIAIILVTVLIKILFWPIAQKGLKSMKNMQKIQPKMAKLKEKYKNDSARLNQEMMGLYKTYKVNPLGGCLPMFLQIPVFFALYKVLLQAIELRHAPFMLWISDLSAPDRLMIGMDIPYLGGIPVLTLLMGGSMFLQQKMTPSPADATQAKIMMFLPVIFTFMFLNFASGLVLYWLVNNLLSIAQQYIINKQAAA